MSKGARVNIAGTSFGMGRHGEIALTRLTPLMHAAPYGSPDLIRTLLDAGAGVDARDGRAMTPLMFAVGSEKQDVAVVRMLLRAGADVNAKSNAGETALDWALKFNSPPVLSILKAAGAEAGAPTSNPPPLKSSSSPDPVRAMTRSIALLQRSSAEFFKQSGCVGCHHQPATAMALHAARAAGIVVDEDAARAQAETLRLSWGVSEEDLLQGIHRGGGSDRLINQLLGLWAAGLGSSSLTDAVLADVVSLQHRDGHWYDEYEPRAPMADGLIARTAYAIRALQVFGWQGRKAEFDERISRARTFLTKAKPLTGDDHAMRLAGLYWAVRPTQKSVKPGKH